MREIALFNQHQKNNQKIMTFFYFLALIIVSDEWFLENKKKKSKKQSTIREKKQQNITFMEINEREDIFSVRRLLAMRNENASLHSILN